MNKKKAKRVRAQNPPKIYLGPLAGFTHAGKPIKDATLKELEVALKWYEEHPVRMTGKPRSEAIVLLKAAIAERI